MKLKFTTKYFLLIFSITIIFCLSIGFDISPYLRGPAPYPPEWRWEYLFINTFSKLYLPLFFITLIIGLFFLQETKKIIKKPALFLCLLIVLSLLFQMSVLFFSRAGIPVLIHRIINPELNSYFTAALPIENIFDFLRNYEQEMSRFVYHARSHPPGAILLFYGIKQILSPFTIFVDFANHLTPTHTDVRQVWNILSPLDRATALFSAFFLPFLSTLTIIPIFKTAKRLYGEIIAVRSSFVLLFIPGIVLFIPINDAFLPLFSSGAFYFLVKGLQEKHALSFLLSGLTLFLGVTFNLALLPLLLFFFLFALFFLLRNKLSIKNYVKEGFLFTIGFFLPPILLYLFLDFNFISLIQIILKEVIHIHTRSYTTWLFYNVFDFFIFVGIPLAIIFLTQIISSLRGAFATKQSIKRLPRSQFTLSKVEGLAMTKKFDLIFLSFLIMFIILDLSGSTRGETGRIWSIFMPFILLPAVWYLTKTVKFSTKLFAGILLLQALQILMMQEFWVMLW